MHPLIPLGIGALLGGVAYAVALGGLKERHEKIAFAVGLAFALAAGGILLALDRPPVPGFGLRLLATAGLGLGAVVLGANVGMLAQAGSGGFSSVRPGALVGTSIGLALLAVCAPAA